MNRRGGALLIALALLALGAALLTGSSAAGRLSARSASSLDGVLAAESESRRVVAEVIASWEAADDSFPVGTGRTWVVGPRRTGMNGAESVTRVRLHRVSERRFALAVDCQIGPDDAVVARRRLLALLDRRVSLDSLASLPPRLVGRWGLADLY